MNWTLLRAAHGTSVGGRTPAIPIVVTTLAAIEKLDVLRDNLGHEAALALVVLPLAGLQATIGVDSATLGEVLADQFGEFRPGDDAHPFGLLAVLPVLRRVSVFAGDAHRGDGAAGGGEAHLWIGVQLADDLDHIEAGHDDVRLRPRGPLAPVRGRRRS